MAQFKAFAPNVKVNGQTVNSLVAGMGAFKAVALKILSENGIDNPQPDQWYSQQAWLDSFKSIAAKVGANTLYQIGLKIPENAKFPPTIDSPEKGLQALDMAYHMNHKDGEIGHYNFRKETEHSGKMVCKNPYPSDFDRGIIEGIIKKFKNGSSGITRVTLDPAQPTRKSGADSCTYIVQW